MTIKVKTKCPYADKCIDEGQYKCATCMHNEKRSYYKHYDPYPYYPYQPYYPWYVKPYYETYTPYWTTTCDATSDSTLEVTSYYQST